MRQALLVVTALLLACVQAEARPHHHLYRVHDLRHAMAMMPRDQRMVMMPGNDAMAMMPRNDGIAMMPRNERVVGARPSGCPNAFCGCEASLYRFGRIIPELNLASNWRRFPRAAPAPGMAAVRSGHVMILQQQVGANVWSVHDGNSGGHVTREHVRSLAGYTIVDPGGATGTFGFSGQQQSPSGHGWRSRRIARGYWG